MEKGRRNRGERITHAAESVGRGGEKVEKARAKSGRRDVKRDGKSNKQRAHFRSTRGKRETKENVAVTNTGERIKNRVLIQLTPVEVLKADAKRSERKHNKNTVKHRSKTNKNGGKKQKSRGCGMIGKWAREGYAECSEFLQIPRIKKP